MCHNVIGLVVLLRVPIVVDFVGPVKKKGRKDEWAGEGAVREIRWSRVKTHSPFLPRRIAPHHRRFLRDEPLALPSGPIVPLS